MGEELCEMTWEPEDCIPQSIINEFEQSLQPNMMEIAHPTGLRQTSHTLTISAQENSISEGRKVLKENERLVIRSDHACTTHEPIAMVFAPK